MTTLTSRLIVELVDRMTAPSRAIAGAVQSMRARIDANNKRMEQMRGRMLEAGAVAYGLARAIASPVSAAMEMESVMADVAKVTNFDAMGLKDFEKTIRQMATTEIPMAATELAELAAAAAQSEVPEADLASFTQLAAKAGVAWEVSGGQAGESLAKIRTALNMNNEQLFKYADAINHLSDRTAASAPDMVDFSRRVAAQGEFFGFSETQTLAFGAAMISAGAQSDVAATSFRNMGKALTRGNNLSDAQAAAFQSLGLTSMKVTKRMQKDAVGTTIDVIERINKLPKHLQASTLSTIFGDEARALAPILSRIGLLKEALGEVSDETKYAGSVSKEFQNRSKTSANALQLFRNRLNELGISVGGALLPALNDLMASIGGIVDRMASFASAHPALTRAIVGTTAALVGLRVAAMAAQFALLWMRGGLLTAGLVGLRALQVGGRAASLAFLPFTAALRGARSAMIGFAAVSAIGGTGAGLRALAGGLLSVLNPLRLVRVAMVALRAALIGTGIGAVLVGIAAAGTWIYNNWSNLAAMFKGFGDGFMMAIQPIMPALSPVISGVQSLWNWASNLLGPIQGAEQAFGSLGVQAGRAIGQFVVSLTEIPGKIAALALGVGQKAAEMGRQFYTGAVQGINQLITELGTLAGKIVDAIGSIDLAAIGRQIMASLLAGIKAGAQEVLNYVKSIGSSISGAVSGAASGAWSSLKNSIGMGDGPAVDGARAAGGNIAGGRTYLVGERGPELVTPSRSGYVHPANRTGTMLSGGSGGRGSVSVSIGNIVLNEGSNVRQIAQQLGRAISDELAGLQSDDGWAIS